jgi:hypothetical protein
MPLHLMLAETGASNGNEHTAPPVSPAFMHPLLLLLNA